MGPSSRVDWGGDQSQSRRLSKSSFSGLLARDKSPRAKVNNNKDTGFVVRGGGSANQRTAAGLSGLKVTRVDRRVNTAKNKNDQITRGGGGVSQRRTYDPRVRPEQ